MSERQIYTGPPMPGKFPGIEAFEKMVDANVEDLTLRKILIKFDNADKSTDDAALRAFQLAEQAIAALTHKADNPDGGAK